MGEPLCPLPRAGLSGISFSHEAPGGTTPVSATSSGVLYSAPAVTREQSICRSWRLWGWAADLLSSGQERPWCPRPSGPLSVPGETESWAVSGALCSGACTVGFSLPSVQPPHCGATARAPPSCSQSSTSHSEWSLFRCRRHRCQAAPGPCKHLCAEPPLEPLRAAPQSMDVPCSP